MAALALAGVGALRRWTRLDSLETFTHGSVLGVVAGSILLVPLATWVGSLHPLVIAAVATAAALAGLRLLSGGPATTRESGAPIGRAARWVIGALVVRWAMVCGTAFLMGHDGLSAGHRHVWGDWPHHLIDVTNFAYGDNFPPTHPRYAGHPLNYHYLASLTVAAMVRLGLSPLVAMPLHSFLFLGLTTLAIFAFARRLSGDSSLAALALALFVFGGGLGWSVTLAQALASPHPWATFWSHPWDLTAQWEAHFPWLDVTFAYLVPQRAVLYGIPLALLALTLLWHAIRGGARSDFVIAGVAVGLLPLANLGAMLTLALVTPFLFLLFPRRGFVLFFGVWALLAVPVFLAQQGGGGAFHFIRLQVGWIAKPDHWWWFWLKSLGAFVPLLLWALATPDLLVRPARRFLWAFMPVFAIGNLVVFQPWDWDNTKILVYWFLATSILAAAALTRLWRSRGIVVRAAVVLLVASMTLSGALAHLDQLLLREQPPLATPVEIELAERVRRVTPHHALFLVGLQHNQPVPMLAGRRAVMSYPGWLWSQGLDASARERDVRRMYALDSLGIAKLAAYGVDAVVIGPWERENFHPNQAGYDARFRRAIDLPPYAVYEIRPWRVSAAGAR